jgi:phosphosulfolactate synthase (CoM biosynthesis protein A)
MKMTLTTSQAAGELMSDTNANWSRAGAYALAEYLEEYEESTGEEIELDVCAIRCDFSEHSSLLDWAHDHFSNALEELGFDETEENDDDEIDDKIRSYIQDHGQLIEFDGGIIVSSF